MSVSWNDAQAYINWLSDRTGEAYRLPSEAEWEYAARAGTTTRYSFGDTITPTQANYDRNVGMTAEVGSFPANDFGLYDMHGNVWEWVEDCWNYNFDREGRPDDGTAWTSGDCDFRVLRGGSWGFDPNDLRSTSRTNAGGRLFSENNTDYRNPTIGFRVARTLR